MAQLYPFTDPVVAEETPPKAMVSGRGVYVTDTEGKEYLDAVSGLWCASLGFNHERLADAADKQMRTLPYYHSFMGRTAKVTEDLAAKLSSLLPAHINHVSLGCGGSEAVETASKLMRMYWNAKGKPGKKRIIARETAYHGSGHISASLTGMSYCHEGFDLPVSDVLRTGSPSYFKGAHDGESERDFSKRRASELEALINYAGADTIGAFIGEPVIGSGGVTPPPEGYWEEIQAVLKKYDILLIADEIITGFGRTGAWFASEKYGLTPDLMTMAKQLSSAYFPISAVGISDKVYDTIRPHANTLGTMGHGFTYGGHPVGCAVALETLKIYEEMDLPNHVEKIASYLNSKFEVLENHPAVADMRYTGLMIGIELKEGYSGAFVGKNCEDNGVLFRVIGNILAVSPPYIITEAEMDRCADVMTAALDKLVAETQREAS